MKYKRRSTGEEKVQKIAAGEEGNYRMERVPLKQTDRHHKSPGGDLCIRDRFIVRYYSETMSMNHTLNHLMVRKLNHCSKHFLAINIVVGSAMKAGSCGFYVNKTHEACSFF